MNSELDDFFNVDDDDTIDLSKESCHTICQKKLLIN